MNMQIRENYIVTQIFGNMRDELVLVEEWRQKTGGIAESSTSSQENGGMATPGTPPCKARYALQEMVRLT